MGPKASLSSLCALTPRHCIGTDSSMEWRESRNLCTQTGTVLSNYSRNTAIGGFLGQEERCLMISRDFCARRLWIMFLLALLSQPLVPKI